MCQGSRLVMPGGRQSRSECVPASGLYKDGVIAAADDFAAARYRPPKEGNMLHWALVFFVIALIAAVLGFQGVAGLSAQIGYLFIGVAVIFLVVALLTGRGPTPIP